MLRRLLAPLLATALSLPAYAASQQPQKFLVVEPAVDEHWIKLHGKEYSYVWQSRNDGKNALSWKRYAPDTVLSSYFPYMRDPASAPLETWKQRHSDWLLYRCDRNTIAFQFNHPIAPLDIGNKSVQSWQISNFLSSWQSDIGLDNFQTGDRERFCGTKSTDGQFRASYAGTEGTKKLDLIKLNWLSTISRELHRSNKTVTINYSLDVAPDSTIARNILSNIDGMIYEDYWGGTYPKGIYSSDSRMLDLMKFFSAANKSKKSVYFIFQLRNVDRPSIQTAMATYLINAGDRTAVYISAIQRYGIVPDYKGYDRTVGKPCGQPVLRDGFIVRDFTGARVALRLPDEYPATLPFDGSQFTDVDGNTLPTSIQMNAGNGVIAYRNNDAQCSAIQH